MNKSRMGVLIVVLIVSLTLACAGCRPVTPTAAPPPEAVYVPTAESAAATEAAIAVPHEIYAGFTDNSAVPFVMVHQSGESLAVMQDVNSMSIYGVVWTSPDGQSILIYADGNGLPVSAVVGDEVVYYSNYTSETVDVEIIHSDGFREAFTSRLNLDLLNMIMAAAPPTDSLISFNPGATQPLQYDKWFAMKTGLYMYSAASCGASVGFAVSAGAVTGGVGALIGIPLMAYGCSGAILGTMIRAGNILNMDVTGLENLNTVINGIKCSTNPIEGLAACASLIVNETERQEKIANEMIMANPGYSGSQPNTNLLEPAAPAATEAPQAAVPQSNGDSICGLVALSEPFLYNQSTTVAAIFKPNGGNNPSDWWEFHPLGVQVQSRNNEFVFFEPYAGSYVQIWAPGLSNGSFDGMSGYVVDSIGDFAVVSSCGSGYLPAPASSQSSQALISNEISYAAIRQSPGYSNKNNDVDLLANVPAGAIVQILGGPEQADGLSWWNVSWNGTSGWMADHTGSGKVLLIFQ